MRATQPDGAPRCATWYPPPSMPTRASVCMATYNGQTYLEAQLGSILKQLGSEDELVICDDGSEDSTVEMVRAHADPRIRLHVCPHRGVTATFATALQH